MFLGRESIVRRDDASWHTIKWGGSWILPCTLLQLHPVGLLLLDPSSLLQPYHRCPRYYMLFFLFGNKCLGINSLLFLYVIEVSGFLFVCFCILNHVFPLHLGILDAGQLVGFSRMLGNLGDLIKKITSYVKARNLHCHFDWDFWVYFPYCLNVAVMCLCICFAQTFCQILKPLLFYGAEY